jgi:hypothetical protein
MQIKSFPIQNGNSYSIRSGGALIDLEIEDTPAKAASFSADDNFRVGKLGIYENGELLKNWQVYITENGAAFCMEDDFYRALDLFATLSNSQK